MNCCDYHEKPMCSLCGLTFGSNDAAYIHEQRCEHGGVRICCLGLEDWELEDHTHEETA